MMLMEALVSARRLALGSVLVAVFTFTTATAEATCFATPDRGPVGLGRLPLAAQIVPNGSQVQTDGGSVVGMWDAVFLLGQGPQTFDRGFQQFHSDGTELMLSSGLPPALGNVCVGVWKRSGRTVSVRHVAFNWDGDGNLTGTFVMLVTLVVDRRGHAFEGTWVADSYDPGGIVIPEAHAAGVVEGTRIGVE